MRLPTICKIILITILSAGLNCAAQNSYNPGDPAGEDYVLLQILQCALGLCESTACGINREFPNASTAGEWVDMTGNILLMHMNDGSTPIQNDSSNTFTGSYNGSLFQETGKQNQALGFDGTDDAIDFGTESRLQDLSEGTISLWFNLSSTVDSGLGQWVDLVERNAAGANANDFYLDFSNTATFEGRLEVNIRNNINTSYIVRSNSDSWDPNIWHHVAVKWSSSSAELKLFIDGVEQSGSINAYTGSTLLSTADFRVGSSSAGTEHFPGKIDEFAFFSRSLSDTEIDVIYTRQKDSVNCP